MRKRLTKKVVKEVEEVIYDHLVCDKCGKVIQEDTNEVFDFQFKVRIGERYGAEAFWKDYNLDLCKEHANEAMRLLVANGFMITEEEGSNY